MRELDWRTYDVLVVDDEMDNLDAFRFAFRKSFRLHYAEGGQQALGMLDEVQPSLVVADQRMPAMSGIELLGRVKEARPDTFTVLLTAYADLDVLIDAVNSGAVDRYVPKPWDSKELVVLLRQGIDAHVTWRENRRMREQLAQYAGFLERQQRDPLDFGLVAAGGEATTKLMRQVEEVAPATTPVLIEGEAGLEKAVVARAIHASSPREDRPFINVPCAAFPGDGLERELFGYRQGAFEGALVDRAGRTELAHGGTLYLHEAGKLESSLQARLLRLLTEGVSERVGDTEPRPADARLIVSCTTELGDALGEGLLPELRSRLSVFRIPLLPLRDRRDELQALAEHVLRKLAQQNPKASTQMTAEAVAKLSDYGWPGNHRELENVLERAAILARGGAIEAEHLLYEAPKRKPEPKAEGVSLSSKLDEIERSELIAALERHGGNKAEVARALGIHRTTLYYRLKRLNIDA